MQSLIVKKSIVVAAPASMVWDAITNPDLIRKFFFGSIAITDWKEGSTIVFKLPNGDQIVKGVIVKAEPNTILQYTAWGEGTGLPDLPDNYTTVTYRLISDPMRTTVSLTEENFGTDDGAQKRRDISDDAWGKVLEGIKKVVEHQDLSS